MGLFASISSLDNWTLISQDVKTEQVMGQFPAEISEEVSSEYAQYKSLNRENPVVQFVSGNADTLSFTARFYARDAVFSGVKESITQLKKWARRDPKKERPQILSFRVGDGYLSMESCVITGLGSIVYQRPTVLGALRDVSVTINLLSYEEFTMEDAQLYETRYHRAKEAEYFELICENEYGNAYFGDVIRKRHPDKEIIQPSDIIKLPSIEAIQTERVEQKSLILKTAYGKKETPQRTARLEAFDKTNRSHVSHIVVD